MIFVCLSLNLAPNASDFSLPSLWNDGKQPSLYFGCCFWCRKWLYLNILMSNQYRGSSGGRKLKLYVMSLHSWQLSLTLFLQRPFPGFQRSSGSERERSPTEGRSTVGTAVRQPRVVSVDPPWMRNYLHWDPFKLGEPALSLHLSALRSSRQRPVVTVRTVASQLWRFLSPWPLYFSVNLWEPWFWTAASVPTTNLV